MRGAVQRRQAVFDFLPLLWLASGQWEYAVACVASPCCRVCHRMSCVMGLTVLVLVVAPSPLRLITRPARAPPTYLPHTYYLRGQPRPRAPLRPPPLPPLRFASPPALWWRTWTSSCSASHGVSRSLAPWAVAKVGCWGHWAAGRRVPACDTCLQSLHPRLLCRPVWVCLCVHMWKCPARFTPGGDAGYCLYLFAANAAERHVWRDALR